MLQFNNVCFSYPSADYDIFIDLNLDFAQGWAGLVGANGSGKTTLIHQALKQFAGIGLLISHNRQLLDGLCTGIVYLDPPD